jgi:Protein of unknown function (DUF3306)
MSDAPREREGFLARWSRRKAGIAPAADEAPAAAAPPATTPVSAAAGSPEAPPPAASGAGAPARPEPLPTLADVAALTPGADVARFMRPGIDGAVRNAALKKLFSDPRFNVMDGLDTYIDDYGKPDPLPLAMLRRMQQSVALGLFENVEAASDPGELEDKACPDSAAPPAVAQSNTLSLPPDDTEPRAENDPDLRLQSDHADRRPGAGAGPRH